MVDEATADQPDVIRGPVPSEWPGIVVLSSSLQILHMNRQARLLIRDPAPTTPEAQHPNHRTEPSHPAPINLADEIIRVFRCRYEMGEKGPLEIRRSASGSGNPVRIRGVGVPNEHGTAHAHIVLVLTEVSASQSDDHQSSGRMH
ncbi:MAG TPA: hypothetical protein VLH80_05920 [Nitrospiraceae bacterium]|jgi:hypothetical protein|nr:hypothetical protein [Nitrospiraceae bacterium]